MRASGDWRDGGSANGAVMTWHCPKINARVCSSEKGANYIPMGMILECITRKDQQHNQIYVVDSLCFGFGYINSQWWQVACFF